MMDVAGLNKQKSQLWWTVTILMIMCMYWLSNVVLWVPWSHNPQLGILLMLTVNPLFWAAGIYICLASENRTENLMKKALVVASLAVGISLISDYLFFAVYMGSKDVWHITTFYGYAWLAVLTFGEVLLLKKKLFARQYAVTTRLLLILTLCLLLLLFFLFYYLM
ncbi:MAG: hypothetical protein KH897_17975 [Bacteroides sp.]|uniref:hypothetical protein n=1 Tax=Bacteroides sp. TaxID=29523 RepID=UPI0025C6051C|nr:hypothetical protein [Bacteroides sp.]MBS6240204.1 hypothetical protein [Bacteroides sp.]